MWNLINLGICFSVASFVFFKLWYFISRYLEKKAFNELTAKKIEQLIEKQKILADTVITKHNKSAFDMHDREKL